MANLILFAVAPVLIIILYIYIQDKYEKEPPGLLLASFFMGAVLSILITIGIYIVTGNLIPDLEERSVWHQLIQAFVVVALIEEFS